MYIFIKLLQMTFLLFVSLTLAIIPWVPSLLVENVVNFSIIGLFIVAGYLVYLIMREIYQRQEHRNIYKNTAYTLLFFTYVGLFAIVQIGISLTKSSYMKTYTFDNLTFYTYKSDEGSTEVSMKEKTLPLRSLPIASFEYMDVVLEKKGDVLYAIGKGVEEKVYDFKNKEKYE